MKTLGDMGEDAVVAKLVKTLEQRADVIVGPGDDCAVVDVGKEDVYQLLKTDCLVEGVHFETEEDPARVGWKAVARVISDFAAMGGGCDHLLVTVALCADTPIDYVESLYGGMQRCAAVFGADICGGETSSVPTGSADVISVAGTGSVLKGNCVTRSGGIEGDALLVTGTLGGSLAGKHLDFTPRAKEALWLTENTALHAMMDLSDGVARDLPRMADASQCGYQINCHAIPKTLGCDVSQALGDGEDYELMIAVASGEVDDLIGAWKTTFPGTQLTHIGNLCAAGEGDCFQDNGWEHFSS